MARIINKKEADFLVKEGLIEYENGYYYVLFDRGYLDELMLGVKKKQAENLVWRVDNWMLKKYWKKILEKGTKMNLVTKNNKNFELDSLDGQYQYLADFLIQHGANSSYFSCLAAMRKEAIINTEVENIINMTNEKIKSTPNFHQHIKEFKDKLEKARSKLANSKL